MEIQIDFYSKDEVAIQFWLDDNEDKKSELFMFACFTLRQYRNLGKNIVADAFAGFLISDDSVSSFLTKDKPYIADYAGSIYLDLAERYRLIASGMDPATASEKLQITSFQRRDGVQIKVLENEYLSKIPKIIPFKGSGKKQFIMTWQPYRLNTKGFGLLGKCGSVWNIV